MVTTCNVCGKPFENRYSRPAWYGGSCKQCVLKFYDDRKKEKELAERKREKELAQQKRAERIAELLKDGKPS